MTPAEYCAEKVGGAGSNLYYGLLFSSPAHRQGANAVYALALEASEIADECHDPGVARTKLDWWREEIDRLYRGEPRHPVTQALAPLVAERRLERDRFLTLFDEVARTFDRVRYPKFEFLHEHCLRAGGVPALLAARAFGLTHPAAYAGIEMLGAALRLTDILCQLGQDVRRDRLFLPIEDLERFGVRETDLLACRRTPAFESLMAFEVERAVRQLEDALARLPVAARATQLPGVILARLAQAQLMEVRRDGYRVLERRIALTPVRKLWIAWRTRAAERRRFIHQDERSEAR